MLKFDQFSSIAQNSGVNAKDGVIYGVCVMAKGEAKGHGLYLDDKSIDGFLELTKERANGVKVRFGADHDAGADDINGTLKNFRKEGDKIRADLHLLKSDKNFEKLIEMAEKMPHEFGLSASTSAEEELIGHDKFVRFTEIYCVDIVTTPAATKGLFFSQLTNPKLNMTKIALALGLPETATEAEIIEASKLALEAKDKLCKYEAEAEAEAKKKLEAEAKAKKKLEAEAEADDEEKGKEGEKPKAHKFNELEATVKNLSEKIESLLNAANASKEAAHKAEIENLKLEASKDGKIINLSDEALLKLTSAEVKEMISKLPKGQLKLSRGNSTPNKDGKPLDKRSPEFKAHLATIREENALKLGQKMINN